MVNLHVWNLNNPARFSYTLDGWAYIESATIRYGRHHALQPPDL